MSIQVRLGTADDLSTVAALHKDSILGLCGSHYTPTQLAEWTGALKPEAYEAFLRTRAFFVATEIGVVVGFGILDLEAGLINATYVSPDAVGRGVGRSVVEAMERLARANGLSQLSLHSTLNAAGFYEALGFTRGEQTVNTLPSGMSLPCLLMRKSLSPAPRSCS